MLSIHLHQLEFRAFHGLYESEKNNGNDFIVNVDIELDAESNITQLKQTIDYVTVYTIIKKRMAVATPLLETVAQDLTHLIHEFDSRARLINITITKLHPPIADFTGNVGISFKAVY